MAINERSVDYVVVGGPPADWMHVKVFDCTTGKAIDTPIEACVSGGWVRHYKNDTQGRIYTDPNTGKPAEEIIYGNFQILIRDWSKIKGDTPV